MATNSNTATETRATGETGTTSGETANIAEMFASLLGEMRQMNRNIIAISEPVDQGVDEADELHQLEHEGAEHIQNENQNGALEERVESLTNTPATPNLLIDIAMDLDVREQTGGEVNEGLASIVASLMKEKLSEENVQAKVKKYPRPANVEGLRTPRVNPLISNQLAAPVRTQDSKSQKTQNSLVASITATIRATNIVLAQQNQSQNKELVTHLTDAIALALQSFHDMNGMRRQAMKKDLHRDFAALCSSTTVTGNSDYLFGDLSKLTKDISKANKLTKKMRPTNHGARGGKSTSYASERPHYSSSQSSYGNKRFNPYSKGRSNFLYKDRGARSRMTKGSRFQTESVTPRSDAPKEGWRPRRTIKMCSWGGEEPALIGSVEWVEQNAKILSERAVVYINIDISVGGNFVMRTSSSPLIRSSILWWTKKVKDPNAHDGKETLSDIMLERNPQRLGKDEPFIGNLGSGSDYASFYQHIGVPSVDFSYFFGYNNTPLMYPVYHSQHDTFNWVKKYADPKFLFHKAMTQFGGGLLLDYADSPLLPMSISRYSDSLNQSFALLKKQHSTTLQSQGIQLDVLGQAIKTFHDAAKAFETRKADIKPDAKFNILRQFNDQMIQLERAFINPYGLPGRHLVRHVIFAPGLHNSYGSASFPGVTDVLFDVKETGNWAEVKKQISIAVTSILSAAELLAPMSK